MSGKKAKEKQPLYPSRKYLFLEIGSYKQMQKKSANHWLTLYMEAAKSYSNSRGFKWKSFP